MTKPIIYLATPYSHPDLAVVEARFAAVNRAAAHLISQGHVVFSPISMTHPIAMVAGNHLSEAWYGFDRPFMEVSAECVVLMLEGWDRSRGVAEEVAYFKAAGKPVSYLEPGAPREPKPHDAEIDRLMAGELAFYLPNDRRANTGQR